MKRSIILIGYSGHAFVVHSIFNSNGFTVVGYCDRGEKSNNPFSLQYFGEENGPSALKALQQNDFFISIGDNTFRKKIQEFLSAKNLFPVNAIHPSAIIDKSCTIHAQGTMIAAGVCINPFAKIGTGVICNTGSIIEHECIIKDFVHIAPGTVLCGNVEVGESTFIGANSVIKEGIKIGNNVVVGAGSVVIKDVPDNVKIAGNPASLLRTSHKL